MSEITIRLPLELSRKTTTRFSKQIDQTPTGDVYVFDMTGLRHVEPFGMLLLSAVLRRFMHQRGQPGQKDMFQVKGFDGNTYAAHMGLYQSFGLDYGNRPGAAPGSRNYLPLTSIKIRDLAQAHRGVPIGEAVVEHSKKLAQVLIREASGPAFSQIAYAFTEIIRNVVEHSGADRIWYAAQYWPTKNRVELSILDDGIGIRRSLARNPEYRVTDDLEAIRLALKKGVTGVPPPTDEELMQGSGDSWQNTGYGLYIVSGLCREHGAFSVCSGNRCFQLAKGAAGVEDAHHDGTAIRMVLSTNSPDDITSVIARLTKGDIGARTGRSQLPDF